MDEGLQTSGIKYSNVKTRLLFSHLSTFLAARLQAVSGFLCALHVL